jgi:hypothetical protein
MLSNKTVLPSCHHHTEQHYLKFLLLQIYVYYDVQLPSMTAKKFIPEQLATNKENARRAQLLMEWSLYSQR